MLLLVCWFNFKTFKLWAQKFLDRQKKFSIEKKILDRQN